MVHIASGINNHFNVNSQNILIKREIFRLYKKSKTQLYATYKKFTLNIKMQRSHNWKVEKTISC